MNSLEQILYLIKHYRMGEYKPFDYASQLANIYYIHNDGSINGKTKDVIFELAQTADRFSDNEDDLALPGSPFNNINKLNEVTERVYKTLFK